VRAEAEAQLDHVALAGVEVLEQLAHLLGEERSGGVLVGRRAGVRDHIAELELPVGRDRLVQREGAAAVPVELDHLILVPTQLPGQPPRRGILPLGHREPLLGPAQGDESLVDGGRQPDRAALVGDGAGDRLANPDGGVGGEAQLPAGVELLDRAHEPDRPLLHQVLEREPVLVTLEPLGEVHDETQVRLDHALLGGEVAALDAAGELALLRRAQQRHARDLREEVGEAWDGLAGRGGRHGGHARAAS
jgi:hypothetical protein